MYTDEYCYENRREKRNIRTHTKLKELKYCYLSTSQKYVFIKHVNKIITSYCLKVLFYLDLHVTTSFDRSRHQAIIVIPSIIFLIYTYIDN